MKIKKHLKYFAGLKGLILFILFFSAPAYTAVLLTTFLSRLFAFQADTFFFMSVQYSFFILFFLLLNQSPLHYRHLFSSNLQPVLDIKVYTRSIKIFLTGFVSVVLLNLSVEFLPLSKKVLEWITAPNQGYTEVFLQIQSGDYIKLTGWFMMIVFIGPFMEEILFRGFLQESISGFASAVHLQKYKPDIILTAFIFALFHFVSLSNILFAFIVGLSLSFEKRKTGKLTIPILMHCFINLIGLLTGIMFYYN